VPAGTSYPWRDHAKSYNFLFENHIDTQQRGKLTDEGTSKMGVPDPDRGEVLT
jgi:hypothetical protein